MTPHWRVALLSPHYATLDYALPDYFPPAIWQAGQRVLIPLGNSLRLGLLLGECTAQADRPEANASAAQTPDATADTVPSYVVRPLLWPVDREPLLPARYLELAEQLAKRQLLSIGNILGTLLPLGIRSARFTFRCPGPRRPRSLAPNTLKQCCEAELRDLASAWLAGDMTVREKPIPERQQYRLAQDPPWPVRPAAVKQLAVLEYLLERGQSDRAQLVKTLGAEYAKPLASLIGGGLVTPCETPDSASDEAEELATPLARVRLNEEQSTALDKLRAELVSGTGKTSLVYGVTGSGKTVLYLELARACLKAGRSVFLLAPELALASNLYRAARDWFSAAANETPVMLFSHGYLTPARRERVFKAAATAQAPVLVIGTRSALFLPAPAPGLVILDEEHDASFKQDERLNYQAKEIAWFMMQQNKGLLVLGSATPDIKTFFAAEQGVIQPLTLRHRVSGRPLPEISLVDIRSHAATTQLLVPETLARVKEAVAQGDQAIIMLNRRGYSPLMYCLECGNVARCGNCDIGLTYHKARERLVCHYCGQSVPFPLICSNCGACNYLPMGEGTERLEESLAAAFGAETPVLRLDRDSTRRQGRLEDILHRFARRESQILVGTQMLSKGHHFPDVTCVVVADGDLGLNLPDYRATERTFQMLVQVAGRAGRGVKPGAVHIQTRDPGHACWGFVRESDYEGFYRHELAIRKRRLYPPFIRLALLRLNFPVSEEQPEPVLASLGRLARDAGRHAGVTVLGPAPAPLRLLRGRRRFNVLLKAQDWQPIRALYATLLAESPLPSSWRLGLDLDPVDML